MHGKTWIGEWKKKNIYGIKLCPTKNKVSAEYINGLLGKVKVENKGKLKAFATQCSVQCV
jgi:hypothetical protein